MSPRPIYLDYQATTPVDPRVLEAMWPYYAELFGNPHATEHRYGQEAAAAVARARAQVAALIGAEPREVVFTSGATEANNLLLRSAAHAAAAGGRRHIVALPTEHKAVIEVVRRLEAEGFAVTWLPVVETGLVDPAAFARALRPDTGLASVAMANNEIGVIQPIAELGRRCREAGVIFHTDAAQAAGKLPIDMAAMHIDLLSLSAHKLYGPKGIGAAVFRRASGVRPVALIVGGGQEAGARGGTLPVPLCVGLGAAAELAGTAMAIENARLAGLRDRFLARLAPRVRFDLNGAIAPRLPGNLNLSFTGVDAEALLVALKDQVAIASGSACTAQSLEPSHVLTALGFNAERAESAVRIGFGRMTTDAEADAAAEAIAAAVERLQRLARRGAAA